MMKKITEREALQVIYEDYSLEQLERRLQLANESVFTAQQNYNSEVLRRQILQDLIKREQDRLTEYYNSLE